MIANDQQQKTTFEFLVDSINEEGLILGRNGDRDTPVGTTFTTVRRIRVLGELNNLSEEDAGVVGEAALTLPAVHWYQRVIDAVPRGHTAGLEVSGDGLVLLATALGKLPPREYLWWPRQRFEAPLNRAATGATHG